MNRHKRHWIKAIVSIGIILVSMPLTHLVARQLKDGFSGTEQFCGALVLAFVGWAVVITGVFIKGDVKQTLCGLFGGMFFWMGGVDLLFTYYAKRFGAHPLIDPATGEIMSRPEYLLLPATFGFWAMIMLLYLFCTVNGCNFLNWWQRLFFGRYKKEIAARPMTRHTSIVAFMEVTTMLWTCYLVLMTCYDDHLIGADSLITVIVGMIGLIGSVFMFARLLRYPSWGISLRFGFATVIVFWIFVEVCKHTHLLVKLYENPSEHIGAISTIVLCVFAGVILAILKKLRS